MNVIVEDFLKNKNNQSKYKKPGVYSIDIKGHPVYIGVSLCVMDTIAEHLEEILEPKPQPTNLYKFLIEARAQKYHIDFKIRYESEVEETEAIKNDLLLNQAKLCERYFPILNSKVCDIEDPTKWHHRAADAYHFDYWKTLYNLDNEDLTEEQKEETDKALYVEKRKFNYEVKTDRQYFMMYPSTDPNKFVF